MKNDDEIFMARFESNLSLEKRRFPEQKTFTGSFVFQAIGFSLLVAVISWEAWPQVFSYYLVGKSYILSQFVALGLTLGSVLLIGSIVIGLTTFVLPQIRAEL